MGHETGGHGTSPREETVLQAKEEQEHWPCGGRPRSSLLWLHPGALPCPELTPPSARSGQMLSSFRPVTVHDTLKDNQGQTLSTCGAGADLGFTPELGAPLVIHWTSFSTATSLGAVSLDYQVSPG